MSIDDDKTLGPSYQTAGLRLTVSVVALAPEVHDFACDLYGRFNRRPEDGQEV